MHKALIAPVDLSICLLEKHGESLVWVNISAEMHSAGLATWNPIVNMYVSPLLQVETHTTV
jgi:hypothetical protein